MANLKGGTFEKQGKNLFHRLEALGTAKVKGDNLTHPVALAKDRSSTIDDLVSFCEKEFPEGGKMNDLLTPEVMDKFREERFEGLSDVSKENYERRLSSMFQGLADNNIAVHVDREYFDRNVEQLDTSVEKVERYVEDLRDITFERP